MDGNRQTIDYLVDVQTSEEKLHRFGSFLWCNKLTTSPLVLIDVAARAMPPNLGQGMNSGFEDVQVLALILLRQGLEGS